MPKPSARMLDMRSLDLVPISEFQLVTETIRRFRMGYVAAFGAPERDDPLYEAVSEGRRHPGMEHWLPLFQERMDTLFDYLGDAPVAIEPQSEDAARERFKQIADYYEARREALEHPGGGAVYKPLPPDRLYLTEDEWTKRLDEAALARLTPFAVPEGSAGVVDAGARQGRNFTPERADTAINVFEAVVAHVEALQAQRKKVVIALWSEGSRDRMGSMLRDHKLLNLTSVNSWRTVQATPRNEAMLAVVGMESGFETDDVAVISEQDILGDRLVRPRKAQPQARQFHLRGHEPRRAATSWFMSSTASAASSACRRSRSPARRMIVSNCITPPKPSCFCRSRISNCCRATAPTTPMSSSTGSAAAAGRRARPN